jgi:midasin (ATPase involved in ribosome maturation)
MTGSFKPMVEWLNGPLLSAATLGLPMIRDHIKQVKAQVTERMNLVLEQNSLKIGVSFLAPEKGETVEQPLKAEFIEIATLATDSTWQNQLI